MESTLAAHKERRKETDVGLAAAVDLLKVRTRIKDDGSQVVDETAVVEDGRWHQILTGTKCLRTSMTRFVATGAMAGAICETSARRETGEGT